MFPKFSFFEGKKLLLLTHSGADVDSVAAAAAILFSLGKKARAVIGVPDHLNVSAKVFCDSLEIPFSLNPSPEGFEAVVMLDFNSPEMLGSLKEKVLSFRGKTFVFDHHQPSDKTLLRKAQSIVDPEAASATQVVFEWMKKSRQKISPKSCACVACGIIVDSAGFRAADARTFRAMADSLEKSGRSFPELLSLFHVHRDISERIAKLKAARRCRVFKSFEHLVVSTEVGAFEASAAMSIVFLGADVAFAGSYNEGKVLVSARASSLLSGSTGFDLTKHVFPALGEKFSGSGGGHAAAAAFNAEKAELEAVLSGCVLLTHKFFQSHYGKQSGIKEYG